MKMFRDRGLSAVERIAERLQCRDFMQNLVCSFVNSIPPLRRQRAFDY